ncbi:MAG: oxidase [Planctomycetota bacterium]|jgi:NADPH-dependent 2,4-dienoyl-CoA reductase/sulfur reductase-like enzyme/rhodanese-related sulfurtransferase
MFVQSGPRIVIVGGVAGGASAATRARRCNEQAEVILLERDEFVSFANCGMPYHIGGEISDRSRLLVASAALLRSRFRIDVRERTEAIAIDRAKRTLRVRNLRDGGEYEIPWDRLILSPGAAPFVPAVPGVDGAGVFTLRNMADMDRICAAVANSAMVDDGAKAIVVGAGFIGLELVEQLSRRGFKVALVEQSSQVLPPLDAEMAAMLREELLRHNVELYLGNALQQVLTENSVATGVRLSNGESITGSLIILGLGVRPNVALAVEAGLPLGQSGGILTNRFHQTADSEIYAVGDAAEYFCEPQAQWSRVALAGPANRAGRIAGEHAATGRSAASAPVFGTAILRVFDLAAGMTGLTVKAARKAGFEVRSATVIAGQHAGYFPNAFPLTLKVVYEARSGRVLGAQGVGRDGVDKRIDVIATAMAFRATVRDLAGLDLCYAPPFGSAKDPLHQAAFVACNELDGLAMMHDADASLAGFQVVDVRTTSEFAKAPLAGVSGAICVKNVPVDELRERLHELDPELPTIVSCGVGVRGHVAQRILQQMGFAEVRNLTGGAMLRRRAVGEA